MSDEMRNLMNSISERADDKPETILKENSHFDSKSKLENYLINEKGFKKSDMEWKKVSQNGKVSEWELQGPMTRLNLGYAFVRNVGTHDYYDVKIDAGTSY